MTLLTYLSPVVAHRGASAQAPENTLSAFRKAHALHAKWVEFDVQLAACGTPIILHDHSLQRTTNGHGNAAHQSYSTLCQLDAGHWFGAEFAGECIPTLAQVLTYLGTVGIYPNIEIKPNANDAQQTTLATLTCIQQCWPNTLLPPLLSSESLLSLQTVVELAPTLPVGLLLATWQDDWLDYVERLRLASLHFHHAALTPMRVATLKAQCPTLAILAYTVNDPALARSLYAMGVDSLFTDYPDTIVVAE